MRPDRPRVAAAQLIDLIQKHKRIFRFQPAVKAGDNTPWHGTDICLSMAHNIGFIAHAAKRNADVFPDSSPRQ